MTDEIGTRVVEHLARADISAEVNFHGALVVDLIPDKEHLVTGYASWNYGQVFVLQDGCWDDCPCGNEDHHYTPAFSDNDGLEDPMVVAQGIVKFIRERKPLTP